MDAEAMFISVTANYQPNFLSQPPSFDRRFTISGRAVIKLK